MGRVTIGGNCRTRSRIGTRPADSTPDPSYSVRFLAHSPWAFWPLQESSGSTAADASGNSRTGTTAGTVSFGAAGPLGGTAAELTGSSGGGTSSSGILVSSLWSLSGAWTIAGWCRIPTDGNLPVLIGTDTNVSSYYWSIYNRPTGATGGAGLKVLNRATGTTAFQPSGNVTQIPFGTSWHHWAVTKPSGLTATMTFYIDGTPVHTAAATVTEALLAACSLGRVRSGSSTWALTGRLALVGVIEAELSAGQIAALAAATAV